MKNVFMLATLSLAVAVFGCEKAEEKLATKDVPKPAAANPPVAATPAAPTKPKDDHKPGDGHDHGDHDDHAHKDEGGQAAHGGEVVELGSAKLGEFTVRASRDQAEFKPGGDAPIDVWIDGGVGKGVTAVRFWIGAQDAKGSIKAKADIEDGKWHTHTEIPSPIPAGSKLWVEVEASGGQKMIGSFDLKI